MHAVKQWLQAWLGGSPVAEDPPLDIPPDLEPTNPEQAVLVHWLLTHQKDWMVRRVENFQLLDDRTVVRRTSFDFQLPREIEGRPVFPTLRLIPLTTLAKKKLVAFDLRNERGDTLPLLDTRDNAAVAASALNMLAQSVIDRPVHQETRRLLTNIGGMPTNVARAEHDRMAAGRMPNGDPAPPEVRIEWEALVAHPVMQQLLSRLASEFILLTPVSKPFWARRVLKMSYQETYSPATDLGAVPWLAVRLGWSPVVIELDAPATGRCLSYHAELTAPDNSELLALYVDDGEDGLQWDWEPQTAPPARGTLHVQVREGDSEKEGRVRAILRARRSGFLLPSVITCALAFGLLLGTRLQLAALSQSVEAGSALLLIVPALMAAYLLRPDEHALVTTILRGVRTMVVISATCAVSGAALLVVKLQAPWLPFLWTGLVGVSLLMLLGTVASLTWPRANYIR